MSVKPWFALPQPQKNPRALVIGGGLAGLATAYALVKAGIPVTVLEAEAQIAAGASGNLAGLLMPQLSARPSIESEFYRSGFQFTRQVLAELQQQGLCVKQQLQGLLYLADHPRLVARFAKLKQVPQDGFQTISAHEASELAETEITTPGLYLPEAGWVSIPSLCSALVAAGQDKLNIIYQCKVIDLIQDKQGWQVTTEEGGHFSAGLVVIANAVAARDLKLLEALPLQAVPGQLQTIDGRALSLPKLPLCGEAYCLPLPEGQVVLGGSFRAAGDECIKAGDHEKNLHELNRFAPALVQALRTCPWQGRVSVRATSPDHLPLIGPFMTEPKFCQDYARLQHGDRRYAYPQAQYLPGLYLNLAHGARGLAGCLLAGELIATLVSGSVLPLNDALYQAVHPTRFWLKRLLHSKAH